MQQAHKMIVGGDSPRCDRERHLIANAQSGCSDSFGALVERYHGDVVRYLVRRTGDRELAADLTQETFVDAFRQLHRYHENRPFPAWLFRIAHFNLLHEWRRERTRRNVSLDRMLEQRGDTVGALHAGDATDACHERDHIAHALAPIAPTLREPLLLRGVHEFSGREIATMLGISHMAVRQRISRAREAFQHHYKAADGTDADIDGAGSDLPS